jgi:hypothetical protein
MFYIAKYLRRVLSTEVIMKDDFGNTDFLINEINAFFFRIL